MERTAKPFGNGGHVLVPRDWIGHRIEVNRMYETLIDWDREHNPKVVTYGDGKQYVEIPEGDLMGGHRDTVLRQCKVQGWELITRRGKDLIPAYAYDRVMVAGLSTILSRA